MAAEAEPKGKGSNSDKFPGHWLWDDPDQGRYTKFDDATSQQLEQALLNAVEAKTKGRIEVNLNKGPFFGKAKQKGVYTCVLTVDCSDPTNPIINGARQTNNNTGYKRPIKREPSLDPPPDPEMQKLLDSLEGRWQWKDDYGWKEYALEDMAQIEAAFRKGEPKAELSGSAFFAKNPGLYFVEFNYLSHPASAQQHNRKTNYGRWVRRVVSEKAKKNDAESDKIAKMMKAADQFHPWRQYFCPLSKEDFADQKCAEFKCSICLGEFKAEELLENMLEAAGTLDKLEDKKQPIDRAAEGAAAASDDEKKNDEKNLKSHKFDLSRAKGLIPKDNGGDCIVGLSKGLYGHYFHAACIAQALDQKAQCPMTGQAYGTVTGHQPDGRLYITPIKTPCAGYDVKTSVKLLFEFPGGIQNEHHPNPGKIYFGDLREAFVPNNKEGRKYAMLIRLAFKRKLIFHIGRSLTLKQDNRIVFGSIHLKTSTSGGQAKHGFPDAKYFVNLKEELAVKGITEELLDDKKVFSDQEREFVENGFAKSQK